MTPWFSGLFILNGSSPQNRGLVALTGTEVMHGNCKKPQFMNLNTSVALSENGLGRSSTITNWSGIAMREVRGFRGSIYLYMLYDCV